LLEDVTEFNVAEAVLWVAPAVGFLVHLTVGRYNAQRVTQQWQSFPTALDAERLGLIRTNVEGDAETIDLTLDAARDARSLGDTTEAVRFSALAHRIVEEATADRLGRLKTLSLLVRMSLAVTPMPPLKASSFRIGQLKSLTGVAAAFHFFLVSPAERVLLRLQVLRISFRLIFSLMGRRHSEIEQRPTNERAWRGFEDGSADFKTLDREHLDTARACLLSMRLEPRAHVIPQRAR
jgi:hypothetical protein